MPDRQTLVSLARQLEDGSLTARGLAEQCLARQADPAGQGAVAFISIDPGRIRKQADAMDALRATGRAPSPFAGIPVSIKDLFDVEGEVTKAGSRVLANMPPAKADAAPVARLRAAGFIPFGRANMTEFAYSGLGMNPHYGNPASPFEREIGRVSGGSSSGGAVSVAEGIVPLTLGTDTGGSCRIPAAFCSIVGYKPTASRVPMQGTIPLSKSLDSVGPLGNTAECCAIAFSVLSGRGSSAPAPRPLTGVSLGVLRNYVTANMDDTVARAYDRVLAALADAGARLEDVTLEDIERLPELNANGGIAAAEAYAWHRDLLEANGGMYDPRVASRMRTATAQPKGNYERLQDERRAMISRTNIATGRFDALVMPTTPIVPPKFSELENEDDYIRNNVLVLRNPTVANFLDRCAISIPATARGEAPVGFMLMGAHGADEELLALAMSVEKIVRPDA